MVNIKPTIEIYDNEGNLLKAYNKAINKMIDQTFDIDLEQFDFDEVAKGKCKEFDDLVTKLCAKSGLGSADIYSMLLERFIAEYDMDYDVNYVYGLDEFEESKKSAKRSLKESKHSIRFEDFLALNIGQDDAFDIYVNDVYCCISYVEDIFRNHTDLLSRYIIEWCSDDYEKHRIIVNLK